MSQCNAAGHLSWAGDGLKEHVHSRTIDTFVIQCNFWWSLANRETCVILITMKNLYRWLNRFLSPTHPVYHCFDIVVQVCFCLLIGSMLWVITAQRSHNIIRELPTFLFNIYLRISETTLETVRKWSTGNSSSQWTHFWGDKNFANISQKLKAVSVFPYMRKKWIFVIALLNFLETRPFPQIDRFWPVKA